MSSYLRQAYDALVTAGVAGTDGPLEQRVVTGITALGMFDGATVGELGGMGRPMKRLLLAMGRPDFPAGSFETRVARGGWPKFLCALRDAITAHQSGGDDGGGGDIPASTDPYVVMDHANGQYTVDGVTTPLPEIWAKIDQYDDSFDYDTEAANIVPGEGWQHSSSYPGLAPAIMTELAGGYAVRVHYYSPSGTGEAFFEAFNEDWTQDIGFGLDAGSESYAIVYEGGAPPQTSNAGALAGVPASGIFYVHPDKIGMSNCGDAFQSVVPPVTGVPPSFVMSANNVTISKIEIFRGQLTQEQLDSLRDTSQVGISESGKLVQNNGARYVLAGSLLTPDIEYLFTDGSGVDSHQWFKDGAVLDGETGGSYQIPSDISGYQYILQGSKIGTELGYGGIIQSYGNDLTLPFELDTTTEPSVNSHAAFSVQNATPWVLSSDASGLFLSLDGMESLTAAASSGLTLFFEIDVTGQLSGSFYVQLFRTDIDPATSHKRTLELSISDQSSALYFYLDDASNNLLSLIRDAQVSNLPSADARTYKAACSLAPDGTVKVVSNFSDALVSGNIGEAGFTGMFYQGGQFGNIGPCLRGANMPGGATVTVKHIRVVEGPSSDADLTAYVA